MSFVFFFLMIRRPSRTTRPYTLFPYSSLVRSTARKGDERLAVIARLAIGEAEHALFAQRVAAIAGQDVEQVVRVAQAVRKPFNLVFDFLPAHLYDFAPHARPLPAHAATEVYNAVSNRLLVARLELSRSEDHIRA